MQTPRTKTSRETLLRVGSIAFEDNVSGLIPPYKVPTPFVFFSPYEITNEYAKKTGYEAPEKPFRRE